MCKIAVKDKVVVEYQCYFILYIIQIVSESVRDVHFSPKEVD